MTTYELFDGGIAALAHDVDGGTRVHGVIIGEGDITEGLSGRRTRWPADTLQQMEGMWEGKPITMADSLDPEQHVGVTVDDDGQPRLEGAVSMDEKVGEITADAYEGGVGLLFEGFLADWEAEDVVERGLAQVSPVIIRDLELVEGEEGNSDALYEPTEVGGVRDLALVADGAAPSNDIKVGSSPEMTAATAEALSAHFGADLDIEALSVSRPDFNGYDESAWDAPTLSGTFDGDMESARNSATWIEDEGETFGDLSLFVLNGGAELNVNALDSAWRMAPQTEGPTETDVQRLRSLYEGLAVQANEAGAISDDEFDSVWQDRVAAEAGASTSDHRGGDDDSRGGSSPSTPANDDSLIMDLTDKEQELVAAARQTDDPTVVEAEVLDRLTELEEQLNEHEDVIAEAADLDEPEVVDAEQAEAMRERVAIVEEMMAEALTEQKGLREATVEAMSFDAMAAEFQTDEGDLDVEALTQSPETGSGPSTGSGGNGPTDEDIERIETIDQKLSVMRHSLPDERVEALQQEATDLAGADDYESALEVL